MFKTPTRNHISIIVERLGIFFVIIVIGAFNFLAESEQEVFTKDFWVKLADTATGLEDYAVALSGLGFFVVCIAVLFISFLIWRKTSFYIDDSDFVYQRLTIFKKESRLSVANISTVNIERNIFERIVGTSKVKIDLNSSFTAQQTDFTFVLKEGLAQYLKSELLKQKQIMLEGENVEVVDDNQPVQTQEYNGLNAQTIISFSTAQVIRHRLLTLPLIQGLIAVFVLVSPWFTQDTVPQEEGGGIIALILLTVFGGVFATVYSILNHIGYTVKADEKNIFIAFGILKKNEYSFERNKINAVFVKRPLLARIFGLCSLEVAVVGFGNEQKEAPRLCLLLKSSQANEILDRCVPDFICKGEVISSHKSAFLMALIKVVMFTAVLALAGFFIESTTYWIGIMLMFALLLCSGYLSVITKSIAFDDWIFQYSKGIFSKQTTMVKYGDMQGTVVKTNPLTEKYGAGRMNYSILAGALQKSHLTGYFKIDDFNQAGKRVVEAKDKTSHRL